MEMATITVTLSESEKQFLDAQVEAGGYDSPDEFIQELVLMDRQRRIVQRLNAWLQKGIRGGPAHSCRWWLLDSFVACVGRGVMKPVCIMPKNRSTQWAGDDCLAFEMVQVFLTS